LLKTWQAKIALTTTAKALKDLGKEITPALKARMFPADVGALREAYIAREAELGNAAREPGEDG
jgi:hypothetical protein